MSFFLCVIGMVMIIEGIPYFTMPSKMKTWIGKVLEMPDNMLQRFGFVLMIGGMLLVFLGKRGG